MATPSVEELIRKYAPQLSFPGMDDDQKYALLQGIIMQESSGNPNVVGPRTKYGKPVGLMQLLPSTGREVTGKKNPNLKDPETNIDAGVKYLNWLQQRTDSPEETLRAYNWGIGNLNKFKGGKISEVPEEAADYVRNIVDRVKDPDMRMAVERGVYTGSPEAIRNITPPTKPPAPAGQGVMPRMATVNTPAGITSIPLPPPSALSPAAIQRQQQMEEFARARGTPAPTYRQAQDVGIASMAPASAAPQPQQQHYSQRMAQEQADWEAQLAEIDKRNGRPTAAEATATNTGKRSWFEEGINRLRRGPDWAAPRTAAEASGDDMPYDPSKTKESGKAIREAMEKEVAETKAAKAESDDADEKLTGKKAKSDGKSFVDVLDKMIDDPDFYDFLTTFGLSWASQPAERGRGFLGGVAQAAKEATGQLKAQKTLRAKQNLELFKILKDVNMDDAKLREAALERATDATSDDLILLAKSSGMTAEQIKDMGIESRAKLFYNYMKTGSFRADEGTGGEGKAVVGTFKDGKFTPASTK